MEVFIGISLTLKIISGKNYIEEWGFNLYPFAFSHVFQQGSVIFSLEVFHIFHCLYSQVLVNICYVLQLKIF